jgi:hypothetical protein
MAIIISAQLENTCFGTRIETEIFGGIQKQLTGKEIEVPDKNTLKEDGEH